MTTPPEDPSSIAGQIRDLLPRLPVRDGSYHHRGPVADQVDALVLRLLRLGLPVTAVAEATHLPTRWVRVVESNGGKRAPAARFTADDVKPLTPDEQLDAARELSGVCAQIQEKLRRRDEIIVRLAASGWTGPRIAAHCDLGHRRINLIVHDIHRGIAAAADGNS